MANKKAPAPKPGGMHKMPGGGKMRGPMGPGTPRYDAMKKARIGVPKGKKSR